jgi:LmbE family N-acetylglucosaminyl deacetylase
MRVLAIGAHPDDVEILCGGTLALYAQAGHELVIAIATNGNVGSPTLTRDEIAAIRRAEAEASGRLLGAELIWMDFDDEWLFNDRPTRTVFIDTIREARPDVLFVHSPADYHPDHRNAGQLALDAAIPSVIRLVETSRPALTELPQTFVMDTLGGLEFEPDVYVDITDTLAIKAAALARHASQDEWLQHLYGMGYQQFIVDQAELRGREAGVRHAEAFRVVGTYPSRPSLHLLPNAHQRRG